MNGTFTFTVTLRANNIAVKHFLIYRRSFAGFFYRLLGGGTKQAFTTFEVFVGVYYKGVFKKKAVVEGRSKVRVGWLGVRNGF